MTRAARNSKRRGAKLSAMTGADDIDGALFTPDELIKLALRHMAQNA